MLRTPKSRRVDRLAGGISVHEMGLVQLVDHVESTHHRYLWDEFVRLLPLSELVVERHAEQRPELYGVRSTLEMMRAEVEPHLQREETELFPMIRCLATARHLPVSEVVSVADPIAGVLDDHAVVVELLETLRELTDDYCPPSDASAEYWDLYDALGAVHEDVEVHLYVENEVLFPAVTSLERRLAAAR